MTTDLDAKPKRALGSEKGHRKLVGGERLLNGFTTEQEAYCRGRAMGMNAQEAVKAAGGTFSVVTARKWEATLPKIKARIQELSEMATQNAILKTGLDREWVISRLMSVAERCMQAEPVLKYDKHAKEMVETGQYTFDSGGANNALKMLGDTLGIFKPAEKKPGDEYAELSDDDIARILAQLATEVGLPQIGAGTQATQGSEPLEVLQAIPSTD